MGRFINGDDRVSSVGGSLLGYNPFAYCFNNPVNLSDPAGNWPKLKQAITSAWNGIKKFVKKTFGVGVVQARQYESFKVNTLFGGEEHGFSTSCVVAGSVDKPISVYAQNASDWWKTNEYKIGIQVNVNNGGISFATGLGESCVTVSMQNRSYEFIAGTNKIGYTISAGVDFGNFTSESYYHQYVRTGPTALALVAIGAAAYYSGGAVLIPLFARGGY